RAPAPAAPQVAVDIDAQAIGYSAALDGDERSSIGELRAVIDDVVNAESLRRRAVFDDVQLRLVGREGKPVRTIDVARHDRCPPAFIEPVDVGRQFLRVDDPGIVAGDAVDGIGEPDRVVGFHHDIVRRVEPLLLEPVDQHRDRSVVFRARNPSPGVLAGEEPALPIARKTVGLVRQFAKDADLPGLLIPTGDAIERGIGPQEIAAIAEPDRSLGPAHTDGETFDAGIVEAILCEARIENLYGRVWVAVA